MSEVPYEPQLPALTNDAKTWGMLCHLSALVGLLAGVAMFAGPLIIWLIKRNDHPFIDDQGKESLNFQISMLIYTVISICLIPCFLIGVPLLAFVYLANIILVIVASMKANSGDAYRYPMTIRLIS